MLQIGEQSACRGEFGAAQHIEIGAAEMQGECGLACHAVEIIARPVNRTIGCRRKSAGRHHFAWPQAGQFCFERGRRNTADFEIAGRNVCGGEANLTASLCKRHKDV